MPASFRRWFDYERDAHAKVLASFETVPAASRAEDGYQKALDLMAHIVAARELWLFRFGAGREPAEVFPRSVGLADLGAKVAAMEEAWAAYLAELDPEDELRIFEYRSLEGDAYRNSVGDILTQLFGHSWYHRGQVAQLVRAIGGEPAVTDFVFWTREAVS